MKKTILKVVLLVLAGVALVLSFEMFFIVRQDQQAVVLRLGKIVGTTTEPGARRRSRGS